MTKLQFVLQITLKNLLKFKLNNRFHLLLCLKWSEPQSISRLHSSLVYADHAISSLSLAPCLEIGETRTHRHLAPTPKPELRNNSWSLRVTGTWSTHLPLARERMQAPLYGSPTASLGRNGKFSRQHGPSKGSKEKVTHQAAQVHPIAHYSGFSTTKNLLDFLLALRQKALLQLSFVSGIDGVTSSTSENTSSEDFTIRPS